MRVSKLKWVIGYLVSTVILSSCNLGATPVPTQDVAAIQTQAFAQVMTEVVAAYTPTSMATDTPMPTSTLAPTAAFAPIPGGDNNSTVTPFAFNTPLSILTPVVLTPVSTLAGPVSTVTTKNGCSDGVLVSESAPYDGDYLSPGQAYEKAFGFLNTGTCAWDEGYVFAFLPTYSTEGFKGYDIAFRKTEDYTASGKGITFIIKLTADRAPGEHKGVWKLKDDSGNYFGSMVWVKYIVNTK
jgi:hypothetical protein